MNRLPFDCDALRQWSDYGLPVTADGLMLITVAEWNQIRSDLLAAADEIELLMAERVKDAA